MIRRGLAIVAVALPLAALGACDALSSLTSGDCTTIAIAGISVTVVDSVTRASLTQGTTVRAYDGSYSDSMTVSGDVGTNEFPIAVAFEHAGTFRVTVTHPGYAAWTVDNVRVTKDGCHVKTVALVAELVRVP